jgi:hypothetical protein
VIISQYPKSLNRSGCQPDISIPLYYI